ncbi:MAG: DUF2125 domain-containing protein [Hyphomicrobiales bacterium]|nr:DUF2125 domain-containing protein [Hyphomicrobiales bacterium]
MVASDKPYTVKKVGGMLYVIAFLVPPAALLWLRKPLQAAIALVCYGLAGFGAVTLVIPGIILFFPIHLVWFGVFWFAPAAYAVATIKARHAGRPVAERADYVFALRRLTLTLFLLIAIPVIGRTLYWFYAAHQLRAEFDRWAAAPGHHMRWSQVAIEGFPFVARLRLTEASFGGTQPLPYDIVAPLTIIEAAPWIGADMRVTMPQGARLHVPSLSAGFETALVEITANFGWRNPTLINVGAQQVSGTESLGDLHIEDVHGQISMQGTSPPTGQKDFRSVNLSLGKLSFPGATPTPGDVIERADINAELIGAWPSEPMREALATWRDNGGAIALLPGTLHWGRTEISIGQGMLTLDHALQPTGSFTIDAVTVSGGVSAPQAEAAEILLAPLLKSGRASQPVEKAHIENGMLMLDAAKLLTLPRVVWP